MNDFRVSFELVFRSRKTGVARKTTKSLNYLAFPSFSQFTWIVLPTKGIKDKLKGDVYKTITELLCVTSNGIRYVVMNCFWALRQFILSICFRTFLTCFNLFYEC